MSSSGRFHRKQKGSKNRLQRTKYTNPFSSSHFVFFDQPSLGNYQFTTEHLYRNPSYLVEPLLNCVVNNDVRNHISRRFLRLVQINQPNQECNNYISTYSRLISHINTLQSSPPAVKTYFPSHEETKLDTLH